jgi:seryl-tRNA(Sec) selenium transferase
MIRHIANTAARILLRTMTRADARYLAAIKRALKEFHMSANNTWKKEQADGN